MQTQDKLFYKRSETKWQSQAWFRRQEKLWIASRWKQLDHWKTYAQNRAKNEGITNYTDAVAYDAFMYYMNDIY